MRYKTIIILITTFSIILSSISCIAYEDISYMQDNNQKDLSYNMINRINKLFNDNEPFFWYPGFFITLLLAPFIILYLIIAIILDIGNP